MRKKISIYLLILIAILLSTGCKSASVQLEQNDWSSIWIENANQGKLPRMLFLGDSVMDGYYELVSGNLEGKYYPAWFTTSKFVSNPDLQDELEIVLRRYQFEVIIFNNGLHGWEYTEDQYRSGLMRLVRLLQRRAPQASLIWVQTTPVRLKNNLEMLDPLNQRVIDRNNIAREVMDDAGIQVIDLYSAMLPHPEYYRDGYHYNQDGKDAQAELITEFILSQR